jgi:hypothetical protein
MTCGGCKHFHLPTNSCFSPDEAAAAMDMFFVNTPACEHFERASAMPGPEFPVLAPQMRQENRKNTDLSDWLSPETRAKLRPLGQATFLERSAEK